MTQMDSRSMALVARRGALPTPAPEGLDLVALKRLYNRVQDIAYYQNAGGGNPGSPMSQRTGAYTWRTYIHDELRAARRKGTPDGDDNGFF